jgi:hypothetical protein
MREGKLARAIREHLTAHPDEAFSTDDLCAVCYPSARLIERKHRVAVLRASDKVRGLPDWRTQSGRVWGGWKLVFFNAASIASTAKADVMRNVWPKRWRDDNPPWDAPERLAQAEQHVAEHLVMRDGTDEQRAQLIERQEAEQDLHVAKLQYAAAVARNPIGVLLSSSQAASGNLSELAEKARKLITENDPDAIRDGLKEIAAALDAIARETKDPMATIQERLAA